MTEVNPDTIPRYKEPTWAELRERTPKSGACRNCGYRVPINLDGKVYKLCLEEIVHLGIGGGGEVYECDPDETECSAWEWDGETDEE